MILVERIVSFDIVLSWQYYYETQIVFQRFSDGRSKVIAYSLIYALLQFN